MNLSPKIIEYIKVHCDIYQPKENDKCWNCEKSIELSNQKIHYFEDNSDRILYSNKSSSKTSDVISELYAFFFKPYVVIIVV